MLVYNAHPLPTDCLFSRVIRPQAVICYRPPCHGIRMCLRFCRVMVSSRRVAINKYDNVRDTRQEKLASPAAYTHTVVGTTAKLEPGAVRMKSPLLLDRRAAVRLLVSLAAPLALPMHPPAAVAAVAAGGGSVRILGTPGVELLEPIYEFGLGVDALRAACEDAARWPALRIQLQRFCGGGPFGEQYYVFGAEACHMFPARGSCNRAHLGSGAELGAA